MRIWPLAALAGALALSACGPGPGVGSGALRGPQLAEGAHVPAPQGPAFRLPDAVVPLAYDLHVEVDPGRPSFAGRVRIDLRIDAAVDAIWLHSAELDIDEAHLHRDAAETRAPLQVTAHPDPASELIRLAPPSPLAPGAATIELSFRGRFREHVGLFRQRVDDEPYVFTDFEPIDARRAFPCFDEPRFKTPWRVSMTVPAGAHALSNMPATRSEPLGGGRQRVHFAPTRPLPSYLVAMAAGPFEFVDSPDAQVPVRIVVPRGMAAWAQEAAAIAPPLLDLVQAYFDTPVPFPKLDLISVPELSGAMENPGLITVGSYILLTDPDHPAIPQQRLLALVLAHEFAHLWFGDLVTPAAWNDLWLNEGFATWLADKTLQAWRSERRADLDQVDAKQEAMREDAGIDVRPARTTAHGRDALAATFDVITYKKTGAILDMLEHWMGEDAFRAAMRAYVAAHADATTDTDALIDILGGHSERELRAPLRSFLSTPGVPLVEAAVHCATADADADARARAGANSDPEGVRVSLSQRRYLPQLGGDSDAQAPADSVWSIPVCMRYDLGGSAVGATCALLEQAAQSVALTRPDGTPLRHCPRWLQPNVEARGYYRYAMPAAQLLALGSAPLSSREALDLAHDLRALLASGDLQADDALRLATVLAPRRERLLSLELAELMAELAPLVPEDSEQRLRAHVRQLFGEHARALSLSPRPGESEEDTLLRPELLSFVGRVGRAPWLMAAARQATDTWLRSGRGIAPGMIEVTLRIAAVGGDAALFQRMKQALHSARVDEDQDDTRRLVLAGALASFEQPAFTDELLALVDDTSLPVEVRHRVLIGLMQRPASAAAALEHLDRYRSAPRRSRVAPLFLLTPLLGAPLCDLGHLDRANALADHLAEKGVIRADILRSHRQRVVTQVRSCAATRRAQADAVAAYYR
ncbi:M1 family metallopeptidase [Haliangium ochraceum]|uniref:Aminopeptidase n=1 Tax=Haliangium ochraceum (strain DSM 14365 / JCM 11303 / SMP-2) TaxID=502025 RepID=D0LQF1_HALO1|nr:M1 family metallopeptidase [Haliangium ochraceum]ACY18960.1 Peptidase M1 membrane alanine aminopeptidase [Haliangium ochraceum DSM 14365]